MPTRVVVAYILLVILVAAVGFGVWRAIYFSARNVRRRERRERRARYHAAMDAAADEESGRAD